ncbi:MAG: type II secretion system F family protein [Clostridia bacterium]|nr:type II secretion system F family protein [Clostridia bacterium]
MKFSITKKTDDKENILKELPGFINLLVMFLNSGTNLEDSIRKICISYGDIKEEKRGYFRNEIYHLLLEHQKQGESLIVLFCSFSKRTGVKELSRVSNVLLENRMKGTVLWKKLKEEGDHLWEERKRQMKEKVKLLDSKLAFPLAISLIALLLVSVAPVLLEIG